MNRRVIVQSEEDNLQWGPFEDESDFQAWLDKQGWEVKEEFDEDEGRVVIVGKK